jgi:hypothetical protein
MGEPLRVGDRVRVIRANRLHGHGVGETGRVVSITLCAVPAGRAALIHCEMDRAGPGYLASFYPEEVERAP